MNRDDIQKLLGGYATGTLTPEEQQALFAAALEDQELFDALGREQALHDLLRDPVSKAQLLAALDAPPVRGGFWAWLRRPMVATIAIAGIAGVASVAVWQAAHNRPAATIIVADLKMEEPKAIAPAPAPVPVPEQRAQEPARTFPMKQKAVARDASADQKQAVVMKDVAPAVNLPAAPVPAPTAPPPPPPPPKAMAETVEVTAAAPAQRTVNAVTLNQALADNLAQDARSLFYGNSFVRREADAVPQLASGSGGAQASMPKATATGLRVANGALAKKEVAQGASLGVRVSLLRGTAEAAVTTALNAGESVRLRLTPNTDGFLYVAAREGNTWKMVASGPAERLKPFETPALPFTGSGEKQVYVMLSRQQQILTPQALAGMTRTNLVESTSAQDRATYVVANLQADAPQQVVQSITLTYK